MATSTRRSPYDLFTLQSTGVRRLYKQYPKEAGVLMGRPPKRGKKPIHKSGTIPELLALALNMREGLNAILFHQMVTEILWDRDGRNVVFPPSTAFYEQLLDGRFRVGDDATLNLPHRWFILAMPRGFTYAGVPIPSPIVGYTRNGAEREAVTDWALKAMGCRDVIGTPEKPDDYAQPKLIFFFRNPFDGDDDTCSICSLTSTQIAAVLQANSPEAFEAIVGRYDEEGIKGAPLASATDPSDVVMQWVLTRLIAGLSVYLSANPQAALIDGLPEPEVDLKGLDFRTKPQYRTLSAPGCGEGEEAGDTELSTRRWFFRNLKADRYYQGEHEQLPKGSRWTFVKPTTVGRYKAHTVNDTER